jgi:hypothetical protein
MATLIHQTSNCFCQLKKEHKHYKDRISCLAEHDKAKTSPVFEMKNADPTACISFKTDPLWQAL